MARAADDKTEIIDGFEQSYGYHVEPSFAAGRESMLDARDTFTDNGAFDRVMRVGFGLWTDNGSGHRGWWPDQPEKNHFQPATWQNAVHWDCPTPIDMSGSGARRFTNGKAKASLPHMNKHSGRARTSAGAR